MGDQNSGDLGGGALQFGVMNALRTGNPHFDIPQLLSMYKAGRLNLDDMVTRQYKLEQINEGYRDMLEGKNIRGVIRYTDADR